MNLIGPSGLEERVECGELGNWDTGNDPDSGAHWCPVNKLAVAGRGLLDQEASGTGTELRMTMN